MKNYLIFRHLRMLLVSGHKIKDILSINLELDIKVFFCLVIKDFF